MYTYAFIKTPDIALELPNGIAGPLQIVSEQQIAAIVEPGISIKTIEAILQDDELLKHSYLSYGLVIAEIFRQTTLLPLRFYHCFADLASLKSHLSSHKDTYLTQLTNLEGKGEYILKFIPKPPPNPPVSSPAKGRDYFLAKKQRYQQQQDWKTEQFTEQKLVIDRISQTYPQAIIANSQEGNLQIYILEKLLCAENIRQDIQDMQSNCLTWELQLGDPIPPYDFLSKD